MLSKRSLFITGLGIMMVVLLITGVNYVRSATKGKGATSEVDEANDGDNQVGKTFVLSQLGHVNAEKKRLKVTFGPSYYIPTGLYVEPGQDIKITVNDYDQFNSPQLIISPPVLTKSEDAILDGQKLKPGTKEMTTVRGGILYLMNSSNESDIPPEVTIEGASILPTFELGKTTHDEWKELLEEHHDAPAFELVSDRVTITAGIEHRDLVTDPEQLLVKHDEAVDSQAKASGLDEGDPNPVHHPTKFWYHFRHTDASGVWMYAWMNHTAYHTKTLNKLLDVTEFTKSGWGPWHELGHVHQQGATTPGIFGEVTNNIFSMTVQKEFGQASNLEEAGDYEKAFAYLNGPADDFESLGDMERLVLPWQLQLTYGEDLFPSLYRLVREAEEGELPATDEEKVQQFMIWTSQIAEQNLIPFYERWGWEVEQETKEAIETLDHPELAAPIWWNRDSNHTIRAFDATLETVQETLQSYESALTEDVYEELKQAITKAGEIQEVEEQVKGLTELLDDRKDAISEKVYDILHSQVMLLDVEGN